MHPGFICAMRPRSRMCRVDALPGSCTLTKSLCASIDSIGAYSAPYTAASAAGTGVRCQYSTRMPRAAARIDSSRPISPKPTMPSVDSYSMRIPGMRAQFELPVWRRSYIFGW